MLTNAQKTEIVTSPFKIKDLWAFTAIAKWLYEHELTIDDLHDYLKEFEIREISMKGRLLKRCPECNNIMSLMAVNTKPGNQVGGDWQSQWFCNSCWYDELSLLEPVEEARKLAKEVRK